MEPSRPERDETDDSLRAERESSDRATRERRSGLDEQADRILERAQGRADAVLETARDKADDDPDATKSSAGRAAIAAGRVREDELVQSERDAANERLQRERLAEARRLAALRPLEREKTDRDLFTERARSDDQLAHRDDFLGMVSHDLRNLLCALVMEGSQLSDAASDSDEGRRTIAGMKRLERYVARMNGLVGDLVDVVSIDTGKLSVQRRRVDAATLLAEVVETFKPTAADKDISLRDETAAGGLPADLDAERILQVLANLVNNALKFTPRGGRVAVHAERTADGLRVAVRDTGVGIPPDQLEAVFKRFWQAGEDERRGLGLGLYISKSIIDGHDGRIWAESTVGSGSSFVFTIPDSTEPVA